MSRRALLEEEQKARADEVRARADRRRGRDRPRRLGARLRRVRRPRRRRAGTAPHLRDGLVARGRSVARRETRRRDHGQGAPDRREGRRREDRARPQATQRRSLVAAAERYPVGTASGPRVRIAEFGVFVDLEPGIIGLLPRSETGLPRTLSPARRLSGRHGDRRRVLEVDAPGRRMRLSVTAIQEAEEAAEVRDYARRTDADVQKASLGSLADKLRGALGSKDELASGCGTAGVPATAGRDTIDLPHDPRSPSSNATGATRPSGRSSRRRWTRSSRAATRSSCCRPAAASRCASRRRRCVDGRPRARRLAADLADEGSGRHARRQRRAGGLLPQRARRRTRRSRVDARAARRAASGCSTSRPSGSSARAATASARCVGRAAGELRRHRRGALHQPVGPRLPSGVPAARDAARALAGDQPARVHGDGHRRACGATS